MLRTGTFTHRHAAASSHVRIHPQLGATLLAAWNGDVGQRIDAAFERATQIDAELAEALVAAAGGDAAVIVLAGRRVVAAAGGHARLYAQRDDQLGALAAGVHDIAPSTQLLASSGALPTGEDVFETGVGFTAAEAMIRGLGQAGVWEVGGKTFTVVTLDELLGRSLERLQAQVAVAGAALGFLRATEVLEAKAFPLTAELLEMAAGAVPPSALALIVRCADTAPDYDGLPAAIRDLHAVDFIANAVGREGAGLERAVSGYGPRGRFMPQTLAGLARIGATRHAEILREAIPVLAHFTPGLERVMTELGLAPVPRSDQWTLHNAWGDTPDLLKLAAWHVAHALGDFVTDEPRPAATPKVPPRELVSNPPRATLVAQIAAKFGALDEETPLTSLSRDTVAAIERAFAVPPSFDAYEPDSTVTTLLHRVYDKGNPWALS